MKVFYSNKNVLFHLFMFLYVFCDQLTHISNLIVNGKVDLQTLSENKLRSSKGWQYY